MEEDFDNTRDPSDNNDKEEKKVKKKSKIFSLRMGRQRSLSTSQKKDDEQDEEFIEENPITNQSINALSLEVSTKSRRPVSTCDVLKT
jgi:hypothetical protein